MLDASWEVKVDAGVFTVHCPHSHKVGENVHLLVRPLPGEEGPNTVDGVVADVIFQQNRFKIVVNCAGLAYIASAGLGAIMGAIEEIRENGGDLRLAEMNDTVRNIFEILGFNHLYRIFPSEVEAILSFRGEGTAA